MSDRLRGTVMIAMADEPRPPRRFYVRVFSDDPDELRRLRDSDLDLFPGTRRERDLTPHSVDGLLTLDEVARLVEEGFPVLVEATMEARTHATPVEVDAKAWKREVLRRARRGGS